MHHSVSCCTHLKNSAVGIGGRWLWVSIGPTRERHRVQCHRVEGNPQLPSGSSREGQVDPYLWRCTVGEPLRMCGRMCSYGEMRSVLSSLVVWVFLVASLLLVKMPFVTSSFLLLVVWPGATSSVLATSSDAVLEPRKGRWRCWFHSLFLVDQRRPRCLMHGFLVGEWGWSSCLRLHRFVGTEILHPTSNGLHLRAMASNLLA